MRRKHECLRCKELGFWRDFQKQGPHCPACSLNLIYTSRKYRGTVPGASGREIYLKRRDERRRVAYKRLLVVDPLPGELPEGSSKCS